MTTVEKLAISEEERLLWISRMQRLVKMRQRNHYTKKGIEDAFAEWINIAERLRKGAQIIEHNQKIIKGNLLTHPHMISLLHLYYFLIIVFNLYDDFFREAFTGNLHRYERAYYKVSSVLLPHDEYEGSFCWA